MTMEHIEQELKLALRPADVPGAIACLDRVAGGPGRDITLENVYFDTPDCALARERSAIRLRKTREGWLQTLKAGGGASGGLHSRHEWEMPVAGPELEATTLLAACAGHPIGAAMHTLLPRLIPMFRTDFTRRIWLLTHTGAKIEAALDRGEITATVNGAVRSAPICEIELELLSGDASALLRMAAILRASVPELRPDNASKAQRGYTLRGA